jgi:hypothetical protein
MPFDASGRIHRKVGGSEGFRAISAAWVSLFLSATACGGSSATIAGAHGSADGATGAEEAGGASGGGTRDGGPKIEDASKRDAPGDAETHHPDARSDTDAAESGTPGDAEANADSSDAGVSTCHACALKSCPTQVAACPAGSPCIEYLQCQLACSNDGGSNCSNTCAAQYPSGQTSAAALTLCDLACGAGCVALLAIQGP